MIEGRRVLGLIPARGGSKGVSRKNLREFCGRPLIGWMIEAARNSKCLDRLIVSTEDEEIAEVARAFGAEVPFVRPAELASDDALAIDVILHAGSELERSGGDFQAVAYLQPTSPLCTPADIDGALELFAQKDAQAVRSVARSGLRRHQLNALGDDLNMRAFFDSRESGKNRQDCAPCYRLHGAIYVIDWEFLKRERRWSAERTFAFITSQECSIDIDTEWDFVVAECAMKQRGTA